MQKTKRKVIDEFKTQSPLKKKKVQFPDKVEKADTEVTTNDTDKKKVNFNNKKDGKFPNKFGKKPFDKTNKNGKPFQKNDGKPFKKQDGKSFKKPDGKFKKPDGKFNKPDGKFNKPDGKGKGDGKTPPDEKPKWAEMKKEKKTLRLERRKTKLTPTVFEVALRAKQLAAQIQKKVLQQATRAALCKELHTILKGQYKSIALTHDLSRVIQVLLKYADKDMATEISEELIDMMVPMVQSKYATHCVKRIFKYGTDKIKHDVIKKFYGHVVSLAAHSVSAPVLDYAYGEQATQKEKLCMQQEFYSDIYKNSKDDNVKCLSDTYKDSPQLKAGVLTACRANLQRLLDKNLHDGEVMHAVLRDYLEACSPEERGELLATLSPLLVPLSNSLPGVRAACLALWHSTNKDKKVIVKVVKEHACALAKHRTGHRLLLALFDAVDDTVLVRKTVLAALLPHLKDLANDHWGRMTLHWLVAPYDPAAFHPSLLAEMRAGAAAGSSKKEANVRAGELRAAVLPALLDLIASEPAHWLDNPATALLTATVLSQECSEEVMRAVSGAVCAADWCVSRQGARVPGVEDAGAHLALKKLTLIDKDRDQSLFGAQLLEHHTPESLKLWLSSNRGCFILLKAIENNSGDTQRQLIDLLRPYKKLLAQQTTQGAKLLTKHL